MASNRSGTGAPFTKPRALGLLVAICVLAAAWLVLAPVEWKWPKDQFTREAWQHVPEHDRFRFVRSLIGGKVLIGKSTQAVIEQLGAPSFMANDGSYATYIVQNTSSRGFFVPGLVVLHINFQQGAVTDVFLRAI